MIELMPEPADSSIAAKADAAFRKGAAKIVQLARQTSTSIIIWDHVLGQVRAISPDEAQELLAPGSAPGHSGHPDRSSD
jgi:hypothetical protein